MELADQRIELSADELRAAAERARARLEAEGQIDSVWERQGVGADAAPTFDSLEGKTIELRWRYYTSENGKRKPVRACPPGPQFSPNPYPHIFTLPFITPPRPAHVHAAPPMCHMQVYIWTSGEVVEVADGKTTKRTAKCSSPLPWGAVRIRWPEDKNRDEPESFAWSVLKPVDFNREVHLGWRFDAEQLEKQRA